MNCISGVEELFEETIVYGFRILRTKFSILAPSHITTISTLVIRRYESNFKSSWQTIMAAR